MKIKTLTLALAGTAIMAVAASKDPAVMTINGKDVKLSEFNYLYQKNKQQQIEQETLDKYVDRFVLYKMKVADAEEAGLDTTKSFIKELDGYKADLLKPYLEDTVLREKLVDEAYNMMQTNVSFHHIMTPLGTDPIDNAGQLAQLDSIRNAIAANDELSEEEWTELIQKYTIDPTFKRNKGHYKNTKLGLGGFPYEFEKVVYETPVGEMCKPFRTDYGNHLVYVTNKTPDKGQVHVQHILKLFPREATDSIKLALKGQIDSLYNCAVAGEDFAVLAKKYSDDKGSAAHGGEIRWFYVSEMVPEFEKVAFSLTDGEISEPFETSYGYHIVKKLGHRTPSLQDCRQYIEKVMSRDERADMPRQSKVEDAKKFYNYKENEKIDKVIEKILKSNGGQYDSTFVAKIRESKEPVATFAKEKVTLGEVGKKLNPKAKYRQEAVVSAVKGYITPVGEEKVMRYYIDNLINDDENYRNLIHEYRDGMLLFEISNNRVWEGASKDTEGLKEYFERNRDKYTWKSPHFKGIILSAKNDSVMKAVKDDIAILGADSLTATLHKKYNRDIKMERMLVEKGQNAAADYLFFNGKKPTTTKQQNYSEFMVLEGGLISQPEEYEDVKGQVTSDYQDELEKIWEDELRNKYNVKLYSKVLDTLR